MQEQYIPPGTPTLPVVMADAPTSAPLCAWCIDEQGILAGEDSHGICACHKARMLVEHERHRATRQALKGVRA